MIKQRTFYNKTKTMQDREKISFLNESFKRLPSNSRLHFQVSVTKSSRLHDQSCSPALKLKSPRVETKKKPLFVPK